MYAIIAQSKVFHSGNSIQFIDSMQICLEPNSNLHVILVKYIEQPQSKYLMEAIIIAIRFMQIYIEPHSYFHCVLHDVNGIKHIANLSTNCDILHNINLFVVNANIVIGNN